MSNGNGEPEKQLTVMKAVGMVGSRILFGCSVAYFFLGIFSFIYEGIRLAIQWRQVPTEFWPRDDVWIGSWIVWLSMTVLLSMFHTLRANRTFNPKVLFSLQMFRSEFYFGLSVMSVYGHTVDSKDMLTMLIAFVNIVVLAWLVRYLRVGEPLLVEKK